jgi:hypothetical protein
MIASARCCTIHASPGASGERAGDEGPIVFAVRYTAVNGGPASRFSYAPWQSTQRVAAG